MNEPPVRVERRVSAPPERVYAYFTDPDLWQRWQGTGATLDARPGGALHIRMAGSETAGARGHFVELDPPRRIVVTWGWVDAPFGAVPPDSTTVEIELIPDGDGTLIRLTHRDLPRQLGDRHVAGWTLYLERLGVILAGGDPGPDPSLAAPPA